MSEKSAGTGFDASRREFFRRAGQFAGAGLAAAAVSRALPVFAQTANSEKPMQPLSDERVAKMRAAGATAKLTTQKLTEHISVISGSGGNVGVLTGPDGKVVIDSSYATSAPQLQAALGALGNEPIRLLINTHWHFDHTDGNEWIHNAGGMIMAHENTRARLASAQEVAGLGLHFAAAPAAALPQQTISEQANLYFNQESLALRYYQPAHTDSDIFIHFEQGNVIHAGDIFFNGIYPFIDFSSKGNIAGMIVAANRTLALADGQTKIIPGHGPMADRDSMTQYRDMLVTVHDRVAKLKQAGKSVDEVVAAKPTAEFDARWGKGMIGNDFFVKLVYDTL